MNYNSYFYFLNIILLTGLKGTRGLGSSSWCERHRGTFVCIAQYQMQ